MFIKLTKLDNRPVWLNASFIVTVEPRREGSGAIVVPIGDGLDYDVRESPEEVLRKLEGAPTPAVVPVPVSDCLTKTPPDVSPDAQPASPETPPVAVEPEVKVKVQPEVKVEDLSEVKVEEKGTKTRKRATRGKLARVAAKKAKEPESRPEVPPAALELSSEEVARLKKLAPKSLAKLKNTLATQFQIADIGATVAALTAKGELTLEGNHVNWKSAETDW